MTTIKGFKGFDKDFKCRDMQYSENKEFSEDVEPSLCNRGLHFCEMPLDVFEFYPPNGKNIFADVEAVGTTVKDEKKSATNKLKVGVALSVSAMFKAHFSLIFEKIIASSETTNTSGYKAHANTAGNEAHANTSGDEAHANTAGNYAHANTAGYKAHANTTGKKAHANTAGNEAIACSLGINSKSKAVKGWIIIVDWQQDKNYDWHIHGIHSSKVGGEIFRFLCSVGQHMGYICILRAKNMSNLDTFNDFFDDVMNQKMSVHAFGMYAKGLVMNLEEENAKLKAKKTCDGCKFKPNQDENYYASCQSCSRFYNDEYTK